MVIVTGGAGFIGANLVRGLNRIGIDEILVVDNLTNASKHRNLNGARFRDYIDKTEFLSCLCRVGRPEAIFHQGACTDTTQSDGRYVMRNNFEYSKGILAFAMTERVPLIYASSAAVYGHGGAGFSEKAACEWPLNIYAFSKLMFDNYVRALMHQCPQPVIGLRYFNVYGPLEGHKGHMSSMARQLFDQVLGRGPMRLFRNSERYRRDFIYVDDIVAVNLHLLEHPRSGIYNCGTGVAHTFLEVAEAVRRANGGGEIEYLDPPPELADKYQTFTKADTTALRAAGYLAPFIELEEGIARYHRNLKEARQERVLLD